MKHIRKHFEILYRFTVYQNKCIVGMTGQAVVDTFLIIHQSGHTSFQPQIGKFVTSQVSM